jgi:tetratricopeptide (TPR) repeat protein
MTVAQKQEVFLKKGRTAMQSGYRFLSSFKAEEALRQFDTAIYYARLSKQNKLIAQSVVGAGQALWYMSRFVPAIDSVKLAIQYFRKEDKMIWDLSSALRVLSNLYDETGNYVKAFEAVTEAVELAMNDEDKQNQVLSLVQLGSLYNEIGNDATALTYYEQAKNIRPQPKSYPYRELHRQMGVLYAKRGAFDTAMYHYRLSLPGHPSPRNIYLRMGECYLMQGKIDTAYQYLNAVYPGALEIGDVPILTPAMIGLGRVYLSREMIDSALFMAKGAYGQAAEHEVKRNMLQASLLLADIYTYIKDSAKAYLFYRKHVSLKDSILSEQLKGKLFSFQKNIEEQQQQAQMRMLKWGLFLLIIVALFVILILIQRHKHERLKLQQRSNELKMQALRAQMNPHFIFNCLSAINHFILNGENELASSYLTRFSRLIRLVLVNSEKNCISLEEELDMLKLYLEMETLRFKDAFDYHIRYDAAIEPSMIQVPSFILQPFCENAIWHGLLHKDGKGELIIDLSMQGSAMVCSIADNGIGMARAAAIKTKIAEKKGAFGLSLTTARLDIFNNDNNNQGSFSIADVMDSEGNITGTKVTVTIKNKQ